MLKMLIIDDAEEICFAISEYFILKGWKVKEAYNIEAALNFLRNEKFDVILVDYNMPNINGVVGTRLIRQIDDKVLIIALSILGEEDIAESFLKSGADDFAIKPIKMMDLFYRIKSHLKENVYKDDKSLKIKEKIIKKGYPKGIDKDTFKLIEEYLFKNGDFVDVDEIYFNVKIAKKTANRYLQYMVLEKMVEVKLTYGKIGRPKKKYRAFK